MSVDYCYHCKTTKEIKPYGNFSMCPLCLKWLRELKLELVNNMCIEYSKMALNNFVVGQNATAVKKCREFAEGKSKSYGLFLYSKEPGNGKTHLGISILKHWILNTWTPYFTDSIAVAKMFEIVTEPELLLEIRRCFSPNSEINEADITEKYSKVEFLLVDDLGKYAVSDASFLQRVWYNIFNERWLNHRITVVTSNKNGAELKEHLGDYTFDRICGMTNRQVVEISGGSKR